jgi:hypothetical protein
VYSATRAGRADAAAPGGAVLEGKTAVIPGI